MELREADTERECKVRLMRLGNNQHVRFERMIETDNTFFDGAHGKEWRRGAEVYAIGKGRLNSED